MESDEVLTALHGLIERLASDEGAQVVVLTGGEEGIAAHREGRLPRFTGR